jgi:predicted transglutaminase-like cysteine proteinase
LTRSEQGPSQRGVLNLHLAIFVTAVAIMVGFAAPTCANDRPSDPFGNHTIELNEEARLFEIWESLRDKVLLDKAHFHSCIESGSNTDCESVSTLMKIVEEARQYQGKALLGHLNRSINLMIKAAPSDWTGPLEAITMRDGDCKSYSIAKYAAARVAGFSADHVRLVSVHDRRHHFDHMVVVSKRGVAHSRQFDQSDTTRFRKNRLRADGYFGLQGCPVLSFGVLVGATRVILLFPSNYSCCHRLSVAACQR